MQGSEMGGRGAVYEANIGNPILLPPMQRVRLTADDLPYFCMTTKTCRSLWEDMESCKAILSDAEIMPSSDQGHGSSSHQTSSSFWQRIQCKLYIMCFVSLSCHLNKFLLQENPGWPSAGGPRMDRRAVTNLTPRFAPAALSSEDKRQRGEKPSLTPCQDSVVKNCHWRGALNELLDV